MGWWSATSDGGSFAVENEGLVWGDSVADIMDEALERIAKQFKAAWDRLPTEVELTSGLKFALNENVVQLEGGGDGQNG